MVGSEQEREERQPLLADDTTSTYGANGQNGTGSKLPQSHESDVEAPTERNLAEQASSGTWEKVKYILPALAVGLFLSALDGSIIFANHAKIATDFNRLDLASWISTAFFLAMSSCQPLYGKLSDIFGRKACIIWAFCVFAIGNLFCGLAPNMESFIAARIVQGCGGAGVGTLTTVLISDVIPLRERAPWQGYLNLINAAGLAVGAPIGGLVADTIGWRWTFLCQVPFTLLAIASVVFFLRLGQRDTENWRSKLRRVDFLGALLLIATAVCLLLGLDRGSNVSWRAPIAFVPLAMFPVLFAVFVVVESKFAVEPFTPGHIILDRTVLSVYASSFFNYGGWGALMFYAPLFYQAVDGVSSSQAGLRLLPSIISAVCGTLIGGFILKRTGKYYWLMVTATGNATLAVLFVILGTIYVKFDVLCISIGMSVNSILTGFFVVGSLIALISNIAPEDQAIATACMFLFRSLGTACGISFSGTMLQHFLRSNLNRVLQNSDGIDEIVNGVRGSLDYIKTLNPDIQGTVRSEYGASVRIAFIFQMCLFLASFVATCWIREKKLDR